MNVCITDPIFHDEAKAEEHIFRSRWPDGEPFCPHCGSTNTMQMGGKTQAGYWLCRDCRDKFTVRTGTVMERSHVPLHKWLLATHLMAASKKGMSAKQMERMLGVTYKTAWFLCHRIREAMTPTGNERGPLGGPDTFVEVDETYVGGKSHNRAYQPAKPKMKVVSLVERDGRARSFHVANIRLGDLRSLLFTNIDRSSHLMTDDFALYRDIGREFATHGRVVHTDNEYVRGLDHSNTAENFFSIFKRGYVGTYHHMSKAHLHRYTAEIRLSLQSPQGDGRGVRRRRSSRHGGQAPYLSADWSARRLATTARAYSLASAANAGLASGAESASRRRIARNAGLRHVQNRQVSGLRKHPSKHQTRRYRDKRRDWGPSLQRRQLRMSDLPYNPRRPARPDSHPDGHCEGHWEAVARLKAVTADGFLASILSIICRPSLYSCAACAASGASASAPHRAASPSPLRSRFHSHWDLFCSCRCSVNLPTKKSASARN